MRALAQVLLLVFLTPLSCGGHEPEGKVLAFECEQCHMTEYVEAIDPVHVDEKPQKCVACHVNIAWVPEDNSGHDQLFLISSGDHRNVDCAGCHPGPEELFDYNCTDSCHRGVHGGKYPRSSQCLECHRETAE